MVTLVRIEPGRKRGYRLTLSDETVVDMPQEVFLRADLRCGQALSEREVCQWRQESEQARAYEAALSVLEYSNRSSAQIKMALLRKGFSDETAEYCVGRLTRAGLLDDAAYAAQIVDAGVAAGHGRRRIAQTLYRKGIGEQRAKDAAARIDPEQERHSAALLAAKLLEKYRGQDERVRRQKAAQAMARRGFDWDTIRVALDTWDEQQE